MAQNEMKAMCAMPVEVRSMEGLGAAFRPSREASGSGRGPFASHLIEGKIEANETRLRC